MITITVRWHKPKQYKTLRGAKAYMLKLVGAGPTFFEQEGRGHTKTLKGEWVSWVGATGWELFG